MTLPDKIISGAQTGVDRAALDFAIERNSSWGGWAPKGWRSEDGAIPAKYRTFMRECSTSDYSTRTLLNMRECTAVLIVIDGRYLASPGTTKTISLADKLGRPSFIFNLNAYGQSMSELPRWLAMHGKGVLNVAGPRESKVPGIHAATLKLLRDVWP